MCVSIYSYQMTEENIKFPEDMNLISTYCSAICVVFFRFPRKVNVNDFFFKGESKFVNVNGRN